MDRETLIKLWRGVWPVCLVACWLLTACKERGGHREATGEIVLEATGRWDAVSDSLWQAVGQAQVWPVSYTSGYQLTFLEKTATGTGGKRLRLGGQLRMLTDSVLWLTAGMFGLEAFRLWVKQDTVWSVNSLEGEVDVRALSNLRHRWPLWLAGEGTGQRFVEAVLLGLIPEPLQMAEVVYMERRPAAAGGAEVLRFGLQPAAGQATAWTGLLVCDVEAGNYRLQGLYWLMPETMGFGQPLQTVGKALPAAAAAALDGAVLSLRCPTADSRRLSWRASDASGVEIQLDYNRQKWNEPVEVSTDLPKKYTLRYAE